MSVIVDIIDGARAKFTTEGKELTRIAHVTKLSGNRAGKLAAALTAPGMPRLGAAHPTVRGARLYAQDIEAIDSDNAYVTLSYRTPPAATAFAAEVGGAAAGGILAIEFSSQSFQEETVRDAAGYVMRNSYFGSASQTNLAGAGLVYTSRLVRANVYRAQTIVRITYARARLDKALITRMTNTVNAQRWSGYPPHTWLCLNLSTRMEDGQWIYTFEAAYKPETWRLVDVIEYYGEAPRDAVLGNGIAEYDVYSAARWSELGIAF